MLSHFLRAATVKESSTYEFSYLGFSTDTSNASTYTFSAQSLGDPHSKREIFVTCIGSVPTGTPPTLASATIGGVSATLQTAYTITGTTQVCFFAAVPSGATGDIVLTFNTSFGNASIGIYRVINRPNIGTNATTSRNGTATSSTTVGLTSITIPANGFLVGNVVSTSTATVNSSSVFTVNGSSNIENYMGTTSYSRIGTTSLFTGNTITFSTTENSRQAAWAFN